MEIKKLEQFKGGWFIGDFENSLLRTKDFEICYKIHKKNEEWPRHYHAVATEYNMLLRGRMSITTFGIYKETLPSVGITYDLIPRDIFIVNTGEIVKPFFKNECELIIVKIPSKPSDKFEV